MNLKASFFYAKKIFFSPSALNKNVMGRKSLLGAVLCIGISLVPLVSLLVVSEAMIDGMTKRMIHLSTRDIQINLSSFSDCTQNVSSFLSASERLSKLDFVKSVHPELQSMNLASANAKRAGAYVRAVMPDTFEDEYFSSLFEIKEGECDLKSSRSIILSSKMAEDLSVHAGDKISLINMNVKPGGKISPRSFTFTVKGIVSSGYQELDALWSFISIYDGFETQGLSSASFIIGLTTGDSFSPEINRYVKDINSFIYEKGENFDMYGADVFTWQEINSSQFENFSSTRLLLILIMILIVLVAAVNISSALVMIVMERSREIGILKTMGASSLGISAAFVFTGTGAGIAGLLTGLPLGLLAAVNINSIIAFLEKAVNFISLAFYNVFNSGSSDFEAFHLLDPAFYIQKIEIQIPFLQLLMISFLTVLLSILVSLIPARRAGKEKIMDTLRKS